METATATGDGAPQDGRGPIGIVGGGQLAWMLAAAARRLGVELIVQTPGPGDPAVALASGVEPGAVDDVAATRRLAARCRAISFENEWVPLDALEPLEAEGVRFVPHLQALRSLVSKRAQRELLDRLHLPSPRWCPLEAVLPPPPSLSGDEGDPSSPDTAGGSEPVPGPSGPPDPADSTPAAPMVQLPPGFHFPLMAKAASGGYDGKGTLPVPDQAALELLLERVDPSQWILEEMVAFDRELALVACRDGTGTVACFPLVQTHQHRQVCDWVLFPSGEDHAVQAFARNVAASLLTALDYVGVLSIEFFLGPSGLQVNELAPRTHNSGHYTIEGCRTSQFEQQVRIVAGLPMGSTDPVLRGALMVNLLGFETDPDPDYGDRLGALATLSGAHLHWYGKRGAAPGRKLGHLTLPLRGRSPVDLALERDRILTEVRALWPLPGEGASVLH